MNQRGGGGLFHLCYPHRIALLNVSWLVPGSCHPLTDNPPLHFYFFKCIEVVDTTL